MFKNKKYLLILIIACMGLFMYKRPQVQNFTKKIINNVYVSRLDNNDPQAATEFIALYKKSLAGTYQSDPSKTDDMVKNVEKLLKNKKLAVLIARNVMGRYIGYMAVDLKTGYCIGHEIVYMNGRISGEAFAKIYINLLQAAQVSCKQYGLKTLIIPLAPHHNFYYEIDQTIHYDFSHGEINNKCIVDDLQKSQIGDLQESQIKILQELGYMPMQGFSKFTQNVKDIVLGLYDYKSAWVKTL